MQGGNNGPSNVASKIDHLSVVQLVTLPSIECEAEVGLALIQTSFVLILCSYGNKTPKVVSVGCVGLWKHNGVLSEFGKIRETGKMCHVMSIDE